MGGIHRLPPPPSPLGIGTFLGFPGDLFRSQLDEEVIGVGDDLDERLDFIVAELETLTFRTDGGQRDAIRHPDAGTQAAAELGNGSVAGEPEEGLPVLGGLIV
ncbi:hypothetical protein [Reyranella sp.]|uniref:hypothetical protein n=1 Tax=Reyranella sp. TaxID=1929291 RepID=UPI002731F485|nr:hypothetical protein [Reyranella sp.]MDP2377788.1 hypothetical protein [Reyranella sp.]